jgi:hypothetical protein
MFVTKTNTMKYLRQFTCELTGSIVVICNDIYGHEASMSLEEYTSNHYCPINVPSKEELAKDVEAFMLRNNVGKRVALHSMIENADLSSDLSEAYGDDNGADESYNKSLRLVEMLEAEPVAEAPNNTLGNMFPELAQLNVA